jgi:hypothetical protein
LLVRKAKKAGASGVDAMMKSTGKLLDLNNAHRRRRPITTNQCAAFARK